MSFVLEKFQNKIILSLFDKHSKGKQTRWVNHRTPCVAILVIILNQPPPSIQVLLMIESRRQHHFFCSLWNPSQRYNVRCSFIFLSFKSTLKLWFCSSTAKNFNLNQNQINLNNFPGFLYFCFLVHCYGYIYLTTSYFV